MVPTQKVPSLQHFRKTEKEVIGGLCRCVLLLPPNPFFPLQPPAGQPARAGARVRTHGPRLCPRSPFLATGSAAVSCARLALPGDPLPSEHGDPERPWPLLSAAGGRVATFVNCKQTHVVLQQSRPCLLLVAFTPRFLLPPPALASFLSLLPGAFWEPSSKEVFGGPGRA